MPYKWNIFYKIHMFTLCRYNIQEKEGNIYVIPGKKKMERAGEI